LQPHWLMQPHTRASSHRAVFGQHLARLAPPTSAK